MDEDYQIFRRWLDHIETLAIKLPHYVHELRDFDHAVLRRIVLAMSIMLDQQIIEPYLNSQGIDDVNELFH